MGWGERWWAFGSQNDLRLNLAVLLTSCATWIRCSASLSLSPRLLDRGLDAGCQGSFQLSVALPCSRSWLCCFEILGRSSCVFSSEC